MGQFAKTTYPNAAVDYLSEATPRAPRAIETAPNTSRAAHSIAKARAQHATATDAIENLTALFADTFNLRTPHARFAVHFLRTLQLRAACHSAGIGYETGRTYLKKLFEVTGTGSQVELVVVLGWVGRAAREIDISTAV